MAARGSQRADRVSIRRRGHSHARLAAQLPRVDPALRLVERDSMDKNKALEAFSEHDTVRASFIDLALTATAGMDL